MSAIDDLIALVKPPSEPRGAAGSVESDGRALRLPPDYAELLNTYGAGTFDDTITVFAPNGPQDGFDMLAMTREDAERRFMIEHEGTVDLPYPRWPAEGGLLQWGSAGGWGLYWKTSQAWPVVIVDESYEAHEELRLTATELVVALLRGSADAPASLAGVAGQARNEFAPAPARLSARREELIELVQRIMDADFKTERELDRAIDQFDESVAHPRASDLIYWPRQAQPDLNRDELTAEEVVDIALAYKPIQL